MGTPRYKGNVSVRQVHFSRVRDEVNGWVTTIKYRGLLESILVAQETDFYVEGASHTQATQAGDNKQDAYLTVIFNARSQEDAAAADPEVNEFSNTWTYGEAREQVELQRLPKYQVLEDVSAGYLERVIQAVEAYKGRVAAAMASDPPTADKDKVFLLTDYMDPPGTTDQITLADELAKLLVSGQTTGERDRYAIRNVRVVPGNSSLTADHAHVNEMWSNDNLVAAVNATADAITQRNLIGDLHQFFDDTYWFKGAPQINEMSNGRYEIVSEFLNYHPDEPEVTYNTIFS
jgi:hypothetical protein